MCAQELYTNAVIVQENRRTGNEVILSIFFSSFLRCIIACTVEKGIFYIFVIFIFLQKTGEKLPTKEERRRRLPVSVVNFFIFSC